MRNASPLYLLALGCLVIGSTGCATPAVGDPCLPEQVPATGFEPSEAYIESSSVQCATRVCLVYQLRGVPPESGKCVPVASARTCKPEEKDCVPDIVCADENDVKERVYCSCRCDAGDSRFAECECPDGFECRPVLEQGGPGVRGSYCLRKGTYSGG